MSSTHVTNQFIYFSIKELVLDVKHLLICFSERWRSPRYSVIGQSSLDQRFSHYVQLDRQGVLNSSSTFNRTAFPGRKIKKATLTFNPTSYNLLSGSPLKGTGMDTFKNSCMENTYKLCGCHFTHFCTTVLFTLRVKIPAWKKDSVFLNSPAPESYFQHTPCFEGKGQIHCWCKSI